MRNRYFWFTLLAALVSLAVFWLPFALKAGTIWGVDFGHNSMQTVVENFDGINFLVVAKSLYDPHLIEVQYASILSGRPNLYFSAHYPAFPLLIRAFMFFVTGPTALLLAIVASNLLLSAALYSFFYFIVQKPKEAMWLSLIALFLPARMLSARTVGANEPLFMFFVLLSLILASQYKHWKAALFGALAVLTRSPGVLLFFAYCVTPLLALVKTAKLQVLRFLPYCLIPLALVGLWVFYGFRFGDFFAYFKVGGNINLYFPPFLVFGSHFDWVSGIWLEDIIYMYLVYSVGIALFYHNWVKARKELLPIFYFGVIYLTMVLFVVHRDIARYALPIAPIALSGFAPYLRSKYVRIGLVILLIPIFLYAWNFILHNTQPVMDWAPFL